EVDALLRHLGIPLDAACAAALARVEALGGSGGLIALGRDGEPVLRFQTAGMARAWVDAGGRIRAAISADEGRRPEAAWHPLRTRSCAASPLWTGAATPSALSRARRRSPPRSRARAGRRRAGAPCPSASARRPARGSSTPSSRGARRSRARSPGR